MSAQPSAEYWRDRPVAVTGGAGFLGRAVTRRMEDLGAAVAVVRSEVHDLRDPVACRDAVKGADVVLHLAARVGGIGFNRRNPGPLAYDNLLMGLNVFEQARQEGVRKLVCAGSVCAYPRDLEPPFHEAEVWNGYPEESNAPYGLAKRTLFVLSDAYRRQYEFNSCVPMMTNLYGPGDNFDLEDSHVIAALIRKFAEATVNERDQVVLWGTGAPTREFLFVEDAARAILLAAEHLETSEPVNIGTGVETPIRELAETIAQIAGYQGQIVWDASMPDGQPARRLDIARARELLGFEPEVSLERGLRETYSWFRDSLELESSGQTSG